MSVTATNNYSSLRPGLDSPPGRAIAITPSDADELATVARAIFVGTGGNLEVVYAGDSDSVVYKNLANGTRLSGLIKQVKAGSTTASDLIAEYD